MSEYDSIAHKRNIYVEAIFIIAGLLLIPVGFYLFFHFFMKINNAKGDIVVQSKLFAYICSVVLDGTILFTGAFDKTKEAVSKRLGLILPTLFIVDFKSTLKTWWTSIKIDGGYLVIYISIMISHLVGLIVNIEMYLH